MNAINKARRTQKQYPLRDSLFFKIQGAPEVISKAAEALENIVKKHAGSRFEFASTEEHAKEMWESRKMALFSSLQLEPGLRCWTTDVWSVSTLTETYAILTMSQCSCIPAPTVGVRNEERSR